MEGDAEDRLAPHAPQGAGAISSKPLQPRVSWDRVHNRLLALPGSQQMALVNGGTIPDTGQYAAYTGNGVRIGELDEEFIYERRVGDAFLLGHQRLAARAHRGRPRHRRRRPRARRPWSRSGAARAAAAATTSAWPSARSCAS